MRDSLRHRIQDEGFTEESVSFTALADIRYLGQSSELMVPLEDLNLSDAILRAVEQSFETEYERLFGHRAERRAFELVNIHVVATVDRGAHKNGCWDESMTVDVISKNGRSVYFGPKLGERETEILTRSQLGNKPHEGPAIIEEYDSTVVVPPDWNARVDALGNIFLEHQNVSY